MPEPADTWARPHIYRQTLLFLFLPLIFSQLEAETKSKRKVVDYAPSVEMSRSEMLSYFQSILISKISSFDKYNEEAYLSETFPEDLYHNIDSLMPLPLFSKYLMKTKNITDRTDSRGISMLNSYQSVLNSECSPTTVFKYSVPQILKLWDGDKTTIYNDLEEWHENNMMTSPGQICNRFRGLSCQYKVATSQDGGTFMDAEEPTCQCTGDGKNVGFFASLGKSKGESKRSYPDACYVRAWKPCKHLSQDYAFRNDYYDAHTSPSNQRGLLAQIVFPVERTHRCRQGTYCLDLVPGMNRAVCWCSEDSDDKNCVAAMKSPKLTVIPLGIELAAIRRNFVKLFISVNDSSTACNPKFNKIVERIADATGSDPTTTGVLGFMKELTHYKDEEVRICDFRRSQFCDTKTRRCILRWACDPGKIHVGMGVCAVENGFPCQSNEECVEKAICKMIRGTEQSVCICEEGYGHKCKLKNSPFFGQLFHPVVSGFSKNEFVKLQEDISNILKSWEDSMKGNEGDTCNPALDKQAMELVNYFGNLIVYDKQKGNTLLKNAQTMTQEGQPLCFYNRFLRCHTKEEKCVPIFGSRTVKNPSQSADQRKVTVEVDPGEECGETNLPTLFRDVVALICPIGHTCRTDNDRMVCIEDPKQANSSEGLASFSSPSSSSEYFEDGSESGEPLTGDSYAPGLEAELVDSDEFQDEVPLQSTSKRESTGGVGTRVTRPVVTTTHASITKNATATPICKPQRNHTHNSTRSHTKTDIRRCLNITNQPECKKCFTEILARCSNTNKTKTRPSVCKCFRKKKSPKCNNATDPQGCKSDKKKTHKCDNTTSPEECKSDKKNQSNCKNGTDGLTCKHVRQSFKTCFGKRKNVTGRGKGKGSEETEKSTARIDDGEDSGKAFFGDFCRYNDDSSAGKKHGTFEVCDGKQLLTCVSFRCQCYRGMVFSERHLKCVVPIGGLCDLKDMQLPKWMMAALGENKVVCEYGDCLKENNRKICRPKTDSLLILRKW